MAGSQDSHKEMQKFSPPTKHYAVADVRNTNEASKGIGTTGAAARIKMYEALYRRGGRLRRFSPVSCEPRGLLYSATFA